jgi:hypothetical protein
MRGILRLDLLQVSFPQIHPRAGAVAHHLGHQAQTMELP